MRSLEITYDVRRSPLFYTGPKRPSRGTPLSRRPDRALGRSEQILSSAAAPIEVNRHTVGGRDR